MAHPNDHYRNGQQGGNLQYSTSVSTRPYEPQQYLSRSRTPSFDNGDDRPQLGQAGQAAQGSDYNQYGMIDQSANQSLQRSQSMAQQGNSYFPQSDGGYGPVQASGAQYPGGYQQPGGYDTAPYPTTQNYSGGVQQGGHVPYNPAAYPGPPQRHASTATAGYASQSPQYSPSLGGGAYNPSTFNTPYPNYNTAPKVLSHYTQPQAYGSVGPSYTGYQTRPPVPQTYGLQQQISPITGYNSQSVPAQGAYRPPPPPPLPSSPQSHYNAHAQYGAQNYNHTTTNLPYPAQETRPLQNYASHNTSTSGGLKPEAQYSSDSDMSPPIGNMIAPLPSPPKYGNEYTYNTQQSPQPPPPPAHGYLPERSESTRHPQSRPLPERPYPSYDQSSEYAGGESNILRQGSVNQGQIQSQNQLQYPDDDGEDDLAPDPLFSNVNYQAQNGNTAPHNGFLNVGGNYGGQQYTGYSSASDPEGTAGLEAMRLADADEANRNANLSMGYQTHQPAAVPQEASDDEDWPDLDSYGGGFPGDVGYYGAPTSHSRTESYEQPNLGRTGSTATYESSVPTVARTISAATASTMATTMTQDSVDEPQSARRQGGLGWDIPDDYQLHPFAPFASAAVVDDFGTGGLAEPSIGGQAERRLSFDEGAEEVDRRSNSQSPAKRSSDDEAYPGYPELFYHPGPSGSSTRPLPLAPLAPVPHLHQAPAPSAYRENQTTLSGRPALNTSQGGRAPTAPELVGSSMQIPAPQFPRSTSLNAHNTAPATLAPARSKTDAATMKANNRLSMRPGVLSEYESDPSTPRDSLISHLPTIPLSKKKFEPTKLSSREFRKCHSPWALSGIAAWVRELADGEQDLKERTIEDGLVALFTHYVPTMNTADAETLAARVVKTMLAEGALVKDEEWVKFGDGEVSGVIYQICGGGCYSPKLHEQECSGRCYSHHCSRTLKKINLLQHPDELEKKAEDWATFWKIKAADIGDINKKEIERQNNLHEVVQTETEYMEHLSILGAVYRDGIVHSNPPVIAPTKLHGFVKDVFGKADAVRKVSEEHLLPQLKFRQREQGPWIVGFSDIFREWIRKARQIYIDYAAGFPTADMLVRREADRNLLFRTFLDQCQKDPRARRLDWVTFLKAPITRLQRYGLLLSTVLKHTVTDSEEKQNLIMAIEEIKAVTLECDARVDEQTKKVALLELGTKLIQRPSIEVDLRLREKGREVIFRGDLQRHTNRFNFIETHAILFDHYLVLAKTVQQKDVAGGAKQERYDVSRMPIPTGLLVLESTNDEPVIKSTANKLGLGGTTTVKPTAGATPSGTRPGQLNHPSTNLSTNSIGSAAGRAMANGGIDASNEKIMYPFRVKHLGKAVKADENTYTLYAPSAQNRQDWCEKIVLAQERHAASLHAQNAEPFRLRVMADTAFGYEAAASSLPKPIPIRGTPLDRAIKEVEKMFENAGSRPPVVCKAAVNCATSFRGQNGVEMFAIGTDYGVFISVASNPRGWMRAIPVAKVTQIAVLEEFSVFLTLADKALIAYHLDVVIPGESSDSSKRPPQRLSGARDVGFFATGRMKDRMIVIYKKREGISSTFKLLEPVLQKATEKKSRFSRKGNTEFFREFDDFYIPTESYGFNLFHSSLAIQTSKGFEIIPLETKRPFSVPELKPTHVAAIAARLTGQKPLGMFRLSDIEFLLVYEDCAVYVNKHGDVSRSVVMEFVGKARTAALYGPYILLFDNDFVEIRNAENGRLRQVIAGRDCRCLDDAQIGGKTVGNERPRTVKVGMAHPELEGRQLVVELLLNEGQND
ncbi:CNH domain-containing protein [Peziza echinospora]|nr:CNH domain-containing protein [Peziza echinospora]